MSCEPLSVHLVATLSLSGVSSETLLTAVKRKAIHSRAVATEHSKMKAFR